MTARLFKNARIFTPTDTGVPAAGAAQGAIRTIPEGALVVEDGVIADIGAAADVRSRTDMGMLDEVVDCRGRTVIPGFVDPHTHMCFAALREAEFDLRMAGTPYLEILKQGGGILSSVKAVRAAMEDALFDTCRRNALTALRLGTTTVEIKSGYGLDTETELKMLRVIRRVGRETPLDVVPTFLGAHAVPGEYRDRPDAFVDLVIDEMIPAVRDQGIARFCDVFCEEGVFTIDQGRRILRAAQAAGLRVKIHADEVHDLGGAGLAAELSAASADHLLAAGDVNLRQMAGAGVTAVLLPATAYSLRKPYARAREMIDMGLPVALATDCNPGSSYTESMPFAVGLGVINMRMTPAEALTAATLNAAHAIGMAETVGSLDRGKQADFLFLEGTSPTILAYHAGVSPVAAVFKRGERVF